MVYLSLTYRVEGDKLVVEIDISPEARLPAPASSGGTPVVAITGNFVRVADDLMLGLRLVIK